MATPANLYNRNLPTAALIGRVNVGKSTLFNKIIEKNQAIISEVAGTTRTSNVGTLLWRGTDSTVIDTGGLTFDESVTLEKDIIRQTELAIAESDVLVFVTDGDGTLLPQEREIAKLIQRSGKPFILLANKIDNSKREANFDIGEWMSLGLGMPMYVSGSSGRGVGDFLDALYNIYTEKKLFERAEESTKDDVIRVAIIGKPNVGKSSLFNQLIGEDRVIVSDMAHTTREPHDTDMIYNHDQEVVPEVTPLVLKEIDDNPDAPIDTRNETEKPKIIVPKDMETVPYHMRFIDTAGIRRKNRVSGFLERMGIGKTIHSIEDSDIVLLVLDGLNPVSSQDKQLGGLLERRSKSVIILVNKWDLSDDTTDAGRRYASKLIHAHFPHLKYAPILFVSGLTGLKVHQVFPTIVKAWHGRHTHVANRALEKFLLKSISKRLPSRGKGTNHPKLLGMRQINEAPPIFELYVKAKTSLHRSYLNYLENRLREQFDFTATPIVIKLTKIKR